MKFRMTLTLILLVVLTCTGCGWMKPEIVVHPDAALYVTGTSWGRLEVAAYSLEANALVPVGTISLDDCKGRTIKKYNWEKHIAERALK